MKTGTKQFVAVARSEADCERQVLRDELAESAMIQFLDNVDLKLGADFDLVAERSYEMADAMIRARHE